MQIGKPVLGIDAPPTPTVDLQHEAIREKLKYDSAIKGSAGWFFWIAGFSLFNSILVLFGTVRGTVVGLGTTLLVNTYAVRLGPIANVAAFVISATLSGVFVVFGVFARKQEKWAFIAGMVLYALDTVVFFFFRNPALAVGFHCFVLFCLFGGLGAIDRKRQAEANLAEISQAQS